jgi:8-oxo-dGTP pyrophosphatase MutT (NUDIX family)
MTVPIRDAATVVVLRHLKDGPAILMGQRGAKAAFMPSKFVFPGGAVDAADAGTPVASPFDAESARALRTDSPLAADALGVAAVRELFEETAQSLFAPHRGSTAPDLAPLTFIFRAITPPGRPRRFDARFFLVQADDLSSDPDDFSGAEDELSHLQWVLLHEARALDIPFITEVVLAEVAARLRSDAARPVPFFDNSGPTSLFRHL